MSVGPLNAKRRRRIATLERRANYLEDVLEEGAASPGALGHYATELSALDWALDIIYEHYQLDERAAA